MNKIRRIAYLSVLTFFVTVGVAGFAVKPVKVAAGSFPGINGRIVYTEFDSDYNIYTAKTDGSDVRKLTTDGATQNAPSFSADGTKIVYVDYASGNPQIAIMNADGSGQAALTNNGTNNIDPSFSPDGTKIVFASTIDASNYEIYRMNVDGTSVTRLTTNTNAAIYPQYSPDGTKILYQDDTMSNDEVYVMNADGSNKVNLTNDARVDDYPSWSPDGTKIVYSRHDGTDLDIATMNADGSNVTTLTTNNNFETNPIYSPDGQYIGFRDFTGQVLRIMNADGTNLHSVVSGSVSMRDFGWQPLTIKPATTSSNVNVSATNGQAVTVDVPALYTDVYGGVDKSSVGVTNASSGLAYSVNSSTGVITITPNLTAAKANNSWLSKLGTLFFPKVSAATSGTITYQVCSVASSSLCSSGTITIVLAATTTSAGGSDAGTLADTGDNRQSIALAAVSLVIGGFIAVARQKRHAAGSKK